MRIGRDGHLSAQTGNPEMERSQKSKSQGTRKDPYSQLESELQREKDHLMLILEHIDNQKLKLKTEETVLLAMLNIHDPTTTNGTTTPLSDNGLNVEEGNLVNKGTPVIENVDANFTSAFSTSPSISCLSPVLSQSPIELIEETSSIMPTTFRSSGIHDEGSVFNVNDESHTPAARSDDLPNVDSTDMEIANALSILENMSDCEDDDVDGMINVDGSPSVVNDNAYDTGKL
ncbi:10079_t:CDS:2 [Acaulospora colombiana]|uniref:10079_t:CDS:1 n=1 Tax=Acaulospora colombiana TaxID=27376 RepID=A0ACA9LD26_9GLOM|nr:10079_t:CDS:2 [Acaulospora colombiana]